MLVLKKCGQRSFGNTFTVGHRTTLDLALLWPRFSWQQAAVFFVWHYKIDPGSVGIPTMLGSPQVPPGSQRAAERLSQLLLSSPKPSAGGAGQMVMTYSPWLSAHWMLRTEWSAVFDCLVLCVEPVGDCCIIRSMLQLSKPGIYKLSEQKAFRL